MVKPLAFIGQESETSFIHSFGRTLVKFSKVIKNYIDSPIKSYVALHPNKKNKLLQCAKVLRMSLRKQAYANKNITTNFSSY